MNESVDEVTKKAIENLDKVDLDSYIIAREYIDHIALHGHIEDGVLMLASKTSNGYYLHFHDTYWPQRITVDNVDHTLDWVDEDMGHSQTTAYYKPLIESCTEEEE